MCEKTNWMLYFFLFAEYKRTRNSDIHFSKKNSEQKANQTIVGKMIKRSCPVAITDLIYLQI